MVDRAKDGHGFTDFDRMMNDEGAPVDRKHKVEIGAWGPEHYLLDHKLGIGKEAIQGVASGQAPAEGAVSEDKRALRMNPPGQSGGGDIAGIKQEMMQMMEMMMQMMMQMMQGMGGGGMAA